MMDSLLSLVSTHLPFAFPASVSQAQSRLDLALSYGDARTRDWPLMNVWHMVYTVSAYLLLIPILRFLMSFRSQPLLSATNMRILATLHNCNLTVLSLYMCVETLRQAFFVLDFSLFGNGVDSTPRGLGLTRVLYIFYLSKTLEFIDTLIMILKKNDRQISFLHVYHHSSIFVIWWFVIFYAPGGEAYFSAALNSFIHVLMYGYYLWATFAPKLPGEDEATTKEKKKEKKEETTSNGHKNGHVVSTSTPVKRVKPSPFHPAFYKPYITTLQMTQFSLMLVQSVYDLIVPNPYPSWLQWVLFFYMFTMLGLFANFFMRNYLSKGSSAKKSSKKKDE